MRANSRLTLALALVLGLSGLTALPARADLVLVTGQQLVLTADEQALLDNNPALAELAAISPDLLRQALDAIAAALALEPNTRGVLEGLTRDDVQMMGRNPVLLQVWQSSPEASADLLELIRTAAGSPKSTK